MQNSVQRLFCSPAEAEKVPETFMKVVNNGFRDEFGDANNAS
jgi:hypothetical protein